MTVSWQTLLAIGSGGFLGAILRAYLSGLVNQHASFFNLPLGTLGVNLFGSFAMGVLFAYFVQSTLSLPLKSFLSTGILGALTTYSTFAIESFVLLHGGHFLAAAANMGFNLFGTVLFAGLGFKLTRYFFPL